MSFFKILYRKFSTLFMFLGSLAIMGVAAVLGVFYFFGSDLPDYKQLAVYEPAVITRLYAADGNLFAEYAKEKRVFVPISTVPDRVKNAFLMAEDKNFYDHEGVDFMAIFRSVIINIKNRGSGRRPVGGSTITQQVAKNFLLTSKTTYTRKIKEAILSYRIERTFSKDKILELYLNEIYLGGGAYGVASAARLYFGKELDQLTIAESALLAAMPKAPSAYDPRRNMSAALKRRNWVLERMMEEEVIDESTYQAAIVEPITLVNMASRNDDVNYDPTKVYARYFAEEVRRNLMDTYGEDSLYKGGMTVMTTLDPKVQKLADHALRKGLIHYDRRHGWRGPITKIKLSSEDRAADSMGWHEKLSKIKRPAGIKQWNMAVVLSVNSRFAEIGLDGGFRAEIPLISMKWARKYYVNRKGFPTVLGSVRRPSDVVKVGDVVAVEERKQDKGKSPQFALMQIPAVNGAIVVIQPGTGRILAASGGYSYSASQYNRVTQAYRQTGSAFKPFVYLAALEKGMTPATVLHDTPLVIDIPGSKPWRPKNWNNGFFGLNTMRTALEKSFNISVVRAAQFAGMEQVANVAARLKVYDNLPLHYSMVLGAGETTLLKLTSAYATLLNAGKELKPSFVDRIQDRHGHTIFRQDRRSCAMCSGNNVDTTTIPEIVDFGKTVIDPGNAYQITSILQGAVERGTGRRMRIKGYNIAGKTGSSNDHREAWFIGFSPDLVVGVYVGHDNHMPLGYKEYGGSVAGPIFKTFMEEAVKDFSPVPFKIPAGLKMVRINRKTGALARAGDTSAFLEAFKPGTEPDSFYSDVSSSDYGPGSFNYLPNTSSSRRSGYPQGLGGLY